MNPRPALCVPALLLLAALLLGPATACAPVPPRGGRVDIAEESAILLWEPTTRTQHFIRRATFRTEATDFGFLVPTPAKPELAEADDGAFKLLEDVTAPKRRTVRQKRDPNAKSAVGGRGKDERPLPAEPVRVLEAKRVAGFDAVVLEADNAKALNDWLAGHGYPSRPSLTDWLRPYVEAHWKITAFKIAKEDGKIPGVKTAAVRMSFAADRPFFPYREPKEEARPAKGPRAARLLRVYFVGDGRAEGRLGGKEWPGKVAWANQVPDAKRKELLKLLKLPDKAVPQSAWLTEFEDRSAPRPGTEDVYFAPAKDQSAVARPPILDVVYEDDEDAQSGGPAAVIDAHMGWPELLVTAEALALLLGLAVYIFWPQRAG
ncbi:MAG TPA: DUF2330 domain-containing protein [Gemmataceae bacterium]|nr:DUF2330 domain-containing protein [Gemmataceae bacterium]